MLDETIDTVDSTQVHGTLSICSTHMYVQWITVFLANVLFIGK